MAQLSNTNSYVDPMEVVEYNPSWATMFASERDRITSAIGEHIISVEHIGSTSIPGLAAKPIIDMHIVVKDFDQLAQCVDGMTGIGYIYKGLFGIEGRQYFKRPLFHAHMVQHGNDAYMRHTLFLKYLREHESTLKEYAELKKGLAIKWAGNAKFHQGYCDDKTEFIMGVLEQAGWDPTRRP
ncbi:hypothetical protein GGI04_004687 [Coemansia thaxteri]|uniref:GrpB family protein n=1 Tax=Coemansia thaxteri TaxID=2663907 RepID=A0A9W8EF58_9FUNG|nr:hypothetical protein GGI04_004687 [Coemansia thaxteri]KAJ2003052.1 hypothetical protein H4R26_003278 [Coemansia thaxteri]KAJ2484425.1 hypothetical protein EV174_002439 [Coemansia sp. RSA 2320]